MLYQLPAHQHTRQRQQIDGPLPVQGGQYPRQHPRQYGLPQQCRVRRVHPLPQMPPAPHEHHHPQQHPQPGGAEAVTEAVLVGQPGAGEAAQHRAEVDAHIEQGEASVTARVVLGVAGADDGGDIGFEKAHPGDDEGQGQIEHLQIERIPLHYAFPLHDHLHRLRAFDGHTQMARHQQHRPHHHRLAGAEIAVRHHTPYHRRDVDEGGVGGVDAGGYLIAEQEMLGEVEDKQGAHTVVTEALPHLGEKAHGDPAGMAEEPGIGDGSRRGY